MQHHGTQRLETDRLILRSITLEDTEPMFRNWPGDPEVTRFLTWPTHTNADVSRMVLSNWTSRYADSAAYQWAIVYKPFSAVEPIGTIAVVHPIDDRIGLPHIGYCISRPWWRQGITSEALCRMMDYLFDEASVNKVEPRHDVRNPSSGAVMRKCGMKFEGTLRQADWNNQGVHDVSHYGLLASERRQ